MARDEDSSSDEDVPLGKLKVNRPDKVISSSSTVASAKKKKKRIKDETESEASNGRDDSDDDFEPIAKKKKIKAESVKSSSASSANKKKIKKEKNIPVKKGTKAKTPKKSSISNGNANGHKKEKGLKQMDKAERIAHAMQAYLWWNAEEPPKGCQWVKMEHSGVSFPEPYVPHGIKMLYDGEEVDLNPLEEEAATFFAAMDPDGMHLGNPKTAPIFIKNFFTDFRAILGKSHKIKDFKKCDFEPIRRHLNEQKIIRKAITDEERKLNKDSRNEIMFKFGYCIVDGHVEKVGNFNMEPPGAFRGRGEHPKMGKLKQRVAPEQVMINVSECAPMPKCNVPGHAWGQVSHNPTVQWLCQWKENINNQVKYMQLAAQSSFKGKSDRSKYNKAALLCGNIDKIRSNYKKKLTAKSHEDRQLATAMWVIDRLALRVGGEKDTEEEADTVGCCSLRVEHLRFDPNNEGDGNKEIELEFLGKDSMLFKQTIDFGAAMYTENNGMGEQVYENFKLFCKKKKPSDEVFSDLTPTILNAHLKSIMDGLTAKVFRTYNASKTLQDELLKTEQSKLWKNLSPAEKVVEYNNANREVAILCNHQRSVSKAQETQLENLSGKLEALKKQKKVLKKILQRINEGREDTIPKKKDQEKMIAKATKAIEKAKAMKEKAKTKEEKIAATAADEEAKKLRKEANEAKFTQAHLWERVPTAEQVAKRITAWTTKIKNMELNIKHKDDNKEVSLGTSKACILCFILHRFADLIFLICALKTDMTMQQQLNYMDPRISVAWCKRNEVPIEKIFSKTMRDKFNWAMAVPPDWRFNEEIGKQG